MRLIDRIRRRVRARAEDGFTMIVVIGVLVVVLGSTMAAFAAVNGDLPLASNDSSQKQAYAAAEAGIQRYLYALDQNSEFWTQCVPAGSNWIYNPGGASWTNSAPVPGAPGEHYAVELLPAIGQVTYTKCDATHPVASMIQASGTGAGTIRIRVTGFAGNGSVKRTLVDNLREQSFLDYEWFTNYETSDPILQVAAAYQGSGDKTIEPPDLCGSNPPSGCGSNYSAALAGAQQQCAQYRYPPPAGSASTAGYNRYSKAFYTDSSHSYACDQIQFIGGDKINGPFHSNDQVLVCPNGSGPTFGRTTADNIEFGYATGWVNASGCYGNPIIKGTVPSTISILKPPPSNAALQTVASSADTFTGTTCIWLTAPGTSTTGITVAHPNSSYPSCFSASIPKQTLPYPSNGVIYVKNGTCALSYDVENPSYTGNTGCGTVYVQGTDDQPLTIAAENDIVIDGNLTYSTSTSMLGLIANNFVRVYHPIGNQPLGTNSTPCSGTDTAVLKNLTINAMVMSLQHSFVVDQYNCGSSLGTLTVNGGIAQNFRGPVGTSGYGMTGYTKNYTYDDRLRYEEPPHFIDPVQGAWRVQSQTECDITASHACS